MRVPLLLDDFLKRASSLYGGKTAIVDRDRRFTYREFHKRTNQLSNALCSLGLQKGDRVAILSPNSHFFVESFFATSQVGLILVPINFRLTAQEILFILQHSGAKAIIADYDFAGLVDEIRGDAPGLEHFIEARYDDARTENWINLDGWIEAQPSELQHQIECDEDDTVSINYTSGTTAMPKGVELTHRNFYINAYNMIVHLQLGHDDVELWTLPMFHCNGWGAIYALIGLGATHVVLRQVDAKEIFELVEREGVTFMCMAPIVFRMIMGFTDRDKYKIEQKIRVVMGGAPPPASFIQSLETELGWKFVQIYGLTETAPLLTYHVPDFQTAENDYQRRSRAGIPGLGVELQLLDDDDQPVPKDNTSVGEICARGNMVFKGYWQQPEQTEAAIYDGFFHTGDLAVWDEVGNIQIVDRKKDVIISGGENISSVDIEDVLYKHPAVAECAVIGVPHEKWGETPKALVVLHDGEAANEQELIAFCRDNLAKFKCPTSVELLTGLPRTATGKLQKFKLREEYWQGRQQKVAS
jgi:fatty-acyl-CoA synthase